MKTRLLERRLLEPGRTCWVAAKATDSGLLIDGRDYYRAFYHAAHTARRTILVAGWQFDSNVELLRGRDRREAHGATSLLKFLDELCARRPELSVYLLAWDFGPMYVLQREWIQDLRFNWTTNSRLHFRFDDRHAIGASHHQKFAVIDGRVAFVGGMDLCAHRWDDRRHEVLNPVRRDPEGEPYAPYHEVQAYVAGPAVLELQELFQARWKSSGGGDLDLPAPNVDPPPPVAASVPLGPARVGLSRTQARTLEPAQPTIREIRHLYVDAIGAAEELIYVENQYFSSRTLLRALYRRMQDPKRPKLDVVMIYPKQASAITEEIAMGHAQSVMFHELRDVASRHGHAIGIYYVASRRPDGGEVTRYIHSKVMIVDDGFMTVGSANTNNRSLGLDTELNVSWEATGREDLRLALGIRRSRISLLAEHTGMRRPWQVSRLARRRGLVAVLDAVALDRRFTLFPHPMQSRIDGNGAMAPLEALAQLNLDPGRAIEEDIFETLGGEGQEPFAPGIAVLRRRLTDRGRRTTTVRAVDPPLAVARAPSRAWIFMSRQARRLAVGALLLLPFFLVVAIILLARSC